MNKQEALKQIEEQRDMILELRGWGVFSYIKGIINQLDEPQKIEIPKVEFKKSQKVKVPQFVADWIEEARKSCKDVADLFDFDFTNEEVGKWFMQERPFDLVARAWLDGYEVEKERRYIVTLKSSGQKLYYHTEDEDYIFSSYDGVFYSGYHTKTDLEENDMSWIFDCEGVEVQEVE